MKRNLENRRKRMVKQETLHQIKFEAALQSVLLEESQQTKQIVSISTTGHSFTIHDQKQFTRRMLPQILTNSRHFPSFVRLMLKYGFKRIKNKTSICFHRPNFITSDVSRTAKDKGSKRIQKNGAKPVKEEQAPEKSVNVAQAGPENVRFLTV